MGRAFKKILPLVLLTISIELHAQNESGILEALFTDPTSRFDSLIYDEVTSLDQLESYYHSLFPFSSEDFYSSYGSLQVSDVTLSHDTLGIVNMALGQKKAVGYAYFKPSTLDSKTAIFIVPGSGLNQSGDIYRNAPNYHNYPEYVSEAYRDLGDVFVYVKPNEDILSIHYRKMKLNGSTIFAHLLQNNRSYSANYLIQCLGIIKALKSKYERVIIAGLSQGGYASMLLSLISEPAGCIVASGYSILIEHSYYANINQIIIEDLPTHFNKEAIYDMINTKSTYYMFSWGTNEGDYYGVENRELITYNYFKDTRKVSYYNKQAGHLFPPYRIMHDFIRLNNTRPLVTFAQISNCDKLEENVIVEGKGKFPIRIRMKFNNKPLKDYILHHPVDTIKKLPDGEYTFLDPQSAGPGPEGLSVYSKALTIKNLNAITGKPVEKSDFTYNRLDNTWLYSYPVDTTLISQVSFIDEIAHAYEFTSDDQVILPSGEYAKFIAHTRGGCTIEKEFDITLTNPYFSVYPNPFKETFSLEINFEYSPQMNVGVYNFLGDKIMGFDASLGVYYLDLSEQVSGVYVVKLFDALNQINVKTFKVVKY